MSRIRLSQLAALLRAAPAALHTTAQSRILGALAAPAALRAPAVVAASAAGRAAFPRRPLSTTPFAASAGGGDEEADDEAFAELAEAFASLIGTAYEMMEQGKPMEAEALLSRGAAQAEDALGPGSVQVAPLWDQLALFRFLHDRCDDAAEAAAKAWSAVRAFAEEEGSPQARGAAAAAAVRHASALVGARRVGEATPQLAAARADLDAAIAAISAALGEAEAAGDEGAADEARQYLDKFQTAAGEATFYLELCGLAALGEPTPADVERFTPGMEAGLRAMSASMGARHPLTAAALREHNRLTEGAVDSEQGPLAEALYSQEIRLHQAFDPDGEHTAALWYQLGTLQYCHARHEAAVASLRRGLQLLEGGFEGAEEHTVTLKHRLGMALGAGGHHAEARDVLTAVAPELIDRLGEENPMSKELDLMVAGMRLREVRGEAAAGRLTPEAAAVEEAQLLAEMEAAVAGLKPFGEDHMLVKHAGQLLEEAKAGAKYKQK